MSVYVRSLSKGNEVPVIPLVKAAQDLLITLLVLSAVEALVCGGAPEGVECVLPMSLVTEAHAADGPSGKSPYGGVKGGVSSVDEARKVLKEHLSDKALTIGEVKEKKLFFEAEVLDKRGAVIDKVIVDKRTGRVRSIY